MTYNVMRHANAHINARVVRRHADRENMSEPGHSRPVVPSAVTCCRHADKVRWIWEGLHDPRVDCIVACGPGATGKSAAVADALRSAQTRGNSWYNEVLLWNYGDVPCRVPLPGRPAAPPMTPSFTRDCATMPTVTREETGKEEEEEDASLEGARGVIVLRPDADDDLVRALRAELGEERCRTARFVPDPDPCIGFPWL